GSRLSHAVGIAFELCLENKQKREALSATSEPSNGNFSRDNVLRHVSAISLECDTLVQTTMVDRYLDPQSVKLINNSPLKAITEKSSIRSASPVETQAIVEYGGFSRPRPSPSDASRQASMRMFPNLSKSENGPFRRELSLRPVLSSHDPKLDEFQDFLKQTQQKQTTEEVNNNFALATICTLLRACARFSVAGVASTHFYTVFWQFYETLLQSIWLAISTGFLSSASTHCTRAEAQKWFINTKLEVGRSCTSDVNKKHRFLCFSPPSMRVLGARLRLPKKFFGGARACSKGRPVGQKLE
ncbi:hypothetical protein Ciccas_008871, partial [Cichlidogyrus casuarinus]